MGSEKQKGGRVGLQAVGQTQHLSCNCGISAKGGRGKPKILLPSAVHLEERLTVSHSVPAPGQQSVRQKHTVWVFCQWQMRPQAVGQCCA